MTTLQTRRSAQRIPDRPDPNDPESVNAILSSFQQELDAWARFVLPADVQRYLGPEDLRQAVIERILETFGRTYDRQGSFRRWAFGVARNVLREIRRKSFCISKLTESRQVEPGDGAASTEPDPREHAASREVIRRFFEAIAGLEPEEQWMVRRIGLEGARITDVADELNIASQRAFKRWQRLRQRLQRIDLDRLLGVAAA